MINKDLHHGEQVEVAGDRQCLICDNYLTKKQISKKQKFCSHPCYSKNKNGIKHNHGAQISKALLGKKKSLEHVENVRKALIGRKRPEVTGVKHPAWKGDGVGYCALHDWVRNKKGKPQNCEGCGVKGRPNKQGGWTIHWANVSKKYLRKLDDWIGLCRKCHYWFDFPYTKK